MQTYFIAAWKSFSFGVGGGIFNSRLISPFYKQILYIILEKGFKQKHFDYGNLNPVLFATSPTENFVSIRGNRGRTVHPFVK